MEPEAALAASDMNSGIFPAMLTLLLVLVVLAGPGVATLALPERMEMTRLLMIWFPLEGVGALAIHAVLVMMVVLAAELHMQIMSQAQA